MPSALPELLISIPAEGVPLETLADLANRALDDARVAVDDGRAADRLDGRTLRFYQSLSILPKPAYEGRRALYGREHLIRAVAAKQLQAEGYSLAQIQSSLPGQSGDEILNALLELAEPLPRVSTRRASPEQTRARAATPRGPTLHSPEHGELSPRATRVLATHQLAPGVLLTIDPNLVRDPSALLARIARAIDTEPPPQTNQP
ncbi:MAG: MerR family transcriptional regulator [bacterium]